MNVLIFDLLRSFSPKEMKKFNRFVAHDYFNTDRYVVKLLLICQTIIIEKRELDQAVEIKIYKMVFDKTSDISSKIPLSAKLRNQLHAKISLLMKLAKKFLIIESLDETPDAKSQILYKALLKRQQHNLCLRQITKDQKSIQDNLTKGNDFYDYAFQIQNGKLNYLHQKGLLIKKDNLDIIDHELDMSYLLKKLKIHSTKLSLMRISDKKKYDFSSMEAIKPLLQLAPFNTEPLIIVFQSVIQLMEDNKANSYMHLMKLLHLYQSKIPMNNLRDFYLVGSNFCIHQINKGKLNFNQHLYQVYTIMDEKNLLTEKGLIDINRLRNIVLLSCRLQNFEWAKELIHKYQLVFNHQDKKSILHYNSGLIAFYKKDLKKAIHHFIRVDKVNSTYNINARMMLIKAHFQLDKSYDERTMTIFQTAEHFIIKNKNLNGNHKKSYRNFIRIVINIYRIRHKATNMTLDKITQKLASTDFISDKKWLLEKIEEAK